jgi:uncharacterized repeat protein (TIGR03803 family)
VSAWSSGRGTKLFLSLTRFSFQQNRTRLSSRPHGTKPTQTALVVYYRVIMVYKPNYLLLLAVLAILATSDLVGQTATYATLRSFLGYPSDGKSPQGGVTLGKSGALYGTTANGGANNSCLPSGGYTEGCGTAFELAPPTVPDGAWTETVLYSFGVSPDAELPITNMVFGSNGVLYGSSLGGANGNGSVFQLTPPAAAGANWTESVIDSFDLPWTWGPQGTLLVAPDGTLYGTTSGTVTAQDGKLTDPGATVYDLVPPATAGGSWTRSILYRFGSDDEGAGTFPRAGLVATQGLLIGTDYVRGNTSCAKYGCGAVFALQPPASAGGSWTETTLYDFNGAPGDGGGPLAALTVGPGGVLYGTTQYGGSSTLCTLNNVVVGCGTVFQLTPPVTPGGAWSETVLYTFTGQDGDGALPVAGLVLGKNGSLYGTTEYGGSAASGSSCTSFGASGCGTIFELKPPLAPGRAWTETVLHSFTGIGGDGAAPQANLTAGPTGVLYGTTWAGGSAGYGTVFSITVQ